MFREESYIIAGNYFSGDRLLNYLSKNILLLLHITKIFYCASKKDIDTFVHEEEIDCEKESLKYSLSQKTKITHCIKVD